MCQTSKKIEQLYRSHYKKIDLQAKKHRMGHEDSEDILQDVFEKVLKNKDKLKSIDCPEAWITTIAKYQCIDKLRSQSSITKYSDQIKEHTLLLMTKNSEDTIQKVIGCFAEKHLNAYLQKSSRCTENSVAKKFYMEGKNSIEIARFLNIKKNTVLSHLRRFRSRYAKQCHRDDFYSKADNRARMLLHSY